MSVLTKVGFLDVFWAYVAQFLTIGSGIILIPFAIANLSSDQLGFWYLFLSFSSLIHLLELGLQPTIARFTSYVYMGAKELVDRGLPACDFQSDVSIQLLNDLVVGARSLYRLVTLVAGLILFCVGSFYLNTFDEFTNSEKISWVIFCIASLTNLYFTYQTGLLKGRGDQKDLYRITAQSKAVMLSITIPLLYFNLELASMSIGLLVSSIYLRFFLNKKFNDEGRPEVKKLRQIENVKVNYSNTLVSSAWRLGITNLGAFVILRSNQFIASSFIGLNAAAVYGLTLQIVNVVVSLSMMFFNLNMPALNGLQSKRSFKVLVKKFILSVSVGHLLYLMGAIFLVFFGQMAMSLLDSNTQLLSGLSLFLFLLMYYLEMNHSMFAMYLTTMNYVPFMWASLLSGVGIVALSLFLVIYVNTGLMGLILSQLLIQGVYNNWKWPLEAIKDIRLKVKPVC